MSRSAPRWPLATQPVLSFEHLDCVSDGTWIGALPTGRLHKRNLQDELRIDISIKPVSSRGELKYPARSWLTGLAPPFWEAGRWTGYSLFLAGPLWTLTEMRASFRLPGTETRWIILAAPYQPPKAIRRTDNLGSTLPSAVQASHRIALPNRAIFNTAISGDIRSAARDPGRWMPLSSGHSRSRNAIKYNCEAKPSASPTHRSGTIPIRVSMTRLSATLLPPAGIARSS